MSQPDIENAVKYALAQSGKPYRAYGARFGPDYFDCSGLVIASLDWAGVPLPPTINPQQGWGNTVSLYKWAQDVGGLCSVQKAVETRGAILIKGKWYGNGPLGHTSISLGDGREMAAHGYYGGIHVSDLYDGRNYQDGFIIPDVFYQDLQPPENIVDPHVLEAIAKLVKWRDAVSETPLRLGDTNGNVTVLNNLLIRKALMSREHKSNTYTQYTARAVNHLKRLAGFTNKDGKVFGHPAAVALLKRAV